VGGIKNSLNTKKYSCHKKLFGIVITPGPTGRP